MFVTEFVSVEKKRRPSAIAECLTGGKITPLPNRNRVKAGKDENKVISRPGQTKTVMSPGSPRAGDVVRKI